MPHVLRTRRSTSVIVGLAAVIGLTGAAPAMSAVDTTEVTASPGSAAALPSDLALLRTNTSLLGVHTWYRQVQDGYPVVDGLYAVHSYSAGDRVGQSAVWDGRVAVTPLDPAATKATVTVEAAVAAAAASTHGTAVTAVAPSLWVLPGTPSRLVWQVTTVTDGTVAASHVSYVDARTGQVLRSAVESKSDTTAAPSAKDFHTGRALTFDPNPVVALQDEDLTDQGDSATAVPREGYSERKLRHLDASHTLVGRWAQVTNSDIASSPSDRYFFSRANDDFEQVMGYYALDTEQSYYQKLGFTDVNAEAQKIKTNSLGADNSFYSPSQDLIETGRGGVDDAEDPEVVWHEAGHATQDAQVPGFGRSSEAGAMGEGFGDYIGATLSQKFADETALTPGSCLMDWDSVSYTQGPQHCIRTTDTDKVYPDDLQGEVHADGEIWSHALWDINQSIGRDHATTAIVEAQFSFTPSINMPDAAELTVQATSDLYGQSEARKARAAFVARGIL